MSNFISMYSMQRLPELWKKLSGYVKLSLSYTVKPFLTTESKVKQMKNQCWLVFKIAGNLSSTPTSVSKISVSIFFEIKFTKFFPGKYLESLELCNIWSGISGYTVCVLRCLCVSCWTAAARTPVVSKKTVLLIQHRYCKPHLSTLSFPVLISIIKDDDFFQTSV